MSPIYVYSCQACGKEVELLRTIENRDMAGCPDCGARLTRKMSVFTWYMGWEHLKRAKSEPAPEGAGYYPKWDD